VRTRLVHCLLACVRACMCACVRAYLLACVFACLHAAAAYWTMLLPCGTFVTCMPLSWWLQVRAQMAHFATNLQYYITFEVLEGEGPGRGGTRLGVRGGGHIVWARGGGGAVGVQRGVMSPHMPLLLLNTMIGRVQETTLCHARALCRRLGGLPGTCHHGG
jgi:hypothetical protein